MKRVIAILILSLVVPVMAGAQDLASLEHMRQTAEQGNADAQLEMGILYEFGYHMPKNNVSALAWYLRAAAQGNELAGNRRDQLKSHMTPDEIDAANKLSQELMTKQPEQVNTPPATEAPPAAATPSSTEVPPATETSPAIEAPPATEAQSAEKPASLP